MNRARRQQLRTALVRAALRLFSWLPLPLAHAVGAFCGWCGAVLPTDLRRITAINVALCFPDWTAQQRARLVRRSLIETGKGMAELGALWFWAAPRTLRLIRRVSGEAYLEQALGQGKGAIVIAPHLGAWELVGLWCGAHRSITSLYRPPRLAGLDALIRTARQRSGATLVPTNAKGVRALYQALAGNGLVGILPDQDPGREAGAFAPFCGVSANTMTLLSRLAGKSGAPALLVYAERLPRGAGYHLHIEPAPAQISAAELRGSVCALNQAVERGVRALPEQYLWSYKRFKTRPEGERRVY